VPVLAVAFVSTHDACSSQHSKRTLQTPPGPLLWLSLASALQHRREHDVPFSASYLAAEGKPSSNTE